MPFGSVDFMRIFLNAFGAAQQETNDKNFTVKLDSIREYIDSRFAEQTAWIEKRFAEYDAKIDKRFAEYDVKMEKRMNEIRQEIAELRSDFEIKIAQNHASLIRWMFTFYVGTVITLGALLFTFVQVVMSK